jgi:CRP-like cAMP-binding protein
VRESESLGDRSQHPPARVERLILRPFLPDDFLGEIALISGAPRTSTVTATAPSRLLVLNDRDFKQLTREMPSVMASLLEALSERLQADAV